MTHNEVRAMLDGMDDGEVKVCVFCDNTTSLWYCPSCHEYKGLMTIEDWESYTGEVWDE